MPFILPYIVDWYPFRVFASVWRLFLNNPTHCPHFLKKKKRYGTPDNRPSATWTYLSRSSLIFSKDKLLSLATLQESRDHQRIMSLIVLRTALLNHTTNIRLITYITLGAYNLPIPSEAQQELITIVQLLTTKCSIFDGMA